MKKTLAIILASSLLISSAFSGSKSGKKKIFPIKSDDCILDYNKEKNELVLSDITFDREYYDTKPDTIHFSNPYFTFYIGFEGAQISRDDYNEEEFDEADKKAIEILQIRKK